VARRRQGDAAPFNTQWGRLLPSFVVRWLAVDWPAKRINSYLFTVLMILFNHAEFCKSWLKMVGGLMKQPNFTQMLYHCFASFKQSPPDFF